MRKRTLAAMLWLLAGWSLGGFIALVAGISDGLGPIVGTAAAVLFAGDPRRLIWSRESARGDRTVPATTGQQVQHPV